VRATRCSSAQTLGDLPEHPDAVQALLDIQIIDCSDWRYRKSSGRTLKAAHKP
jgi:hypothetical protein